MIKKLKLNINYNNTFLILGIVSTIHDYQLVHYINKIAGFNFIKYDDFLFHGNEKKSLTYSWYYCNSDELKIKSYFIANHHPQQKLLPDYRHIDYLLIIDKSDSLIETDPLVSILRRIKNITGVFKINLSKIKDIELLLEKNEMHEMSQIK